MTIIFNGTGSASGLSLANTQITGTITGSQISANTLANTVFQTGSIENYMSSQNSSFGFRNRIHNGDFKIWQRGTSLSSVAVGSFAADRWAHSSGSAVTANISQSSSYGNPYSMLVQFGSGTNLTFRHRIESYNISDLAGKTVTLSFWMRADNPSAFNMLGYYPSAQDNYATENNFLNQATSYTSNTPTKFTYTFTLPSGCTNGVEFYWQWYSGSAIAPTVFIWDVQLEAGSVATPYERRPIGTELALCQRYAYMHIYGTSEGTGIANGNNYTGTYAQGILHFPVTMRTKPSLTASSGTSYYGFSRNQGNQNLNSLSLDSGNTSTKIGWIYNGSEINATAGQAGIFYAQSASAYLLFSAEL